MNEPQARSLKALRGAISFLETGPTGDGGYPLAALLKSVFGE